MDKVIYSKFSYLPLTKPNMTFKEKLSSWKFFIFNSENRAYLLKDTKDLVESREVSVKTKKNIKQNLYIYKGINGILFAGSLFAILYHFRKGTFKLDSKLLEAYILARTIFIAGVGYSANLALLKENVSQPLFEFYSTKEKQWDQQKKRLSASGARLKKLKHSV